MTPNFFNPDARQPGLRIGVEHTLHDRRAPLGRIPMRNGIMQEIPGPSSAPLPPPYSEVEETQAKTEVELIEE